MARADSDHLQLGSRDGAARMVHEHKPLATAFGRVAPIASWMPTMRDFGPARRPTGRTLPEAPLNSAPKQSLFREKGTLIVYV